MAPSRVIGPLGVLLAGTLLTACSAAEPGGIPSTAASPIPAGRTVWMGANDVYHSFKCSTALDCYTPDVPQVKKNLTTIVDRVHELTAGHAVLVVLLDYWSVWLGGAYAAEQGQAYVATAQQLTDDVNTAIKSVAVHSDSAYVDLRAAFKGPDYSYDETQYLSDDGDHPNAAGHKQIATAATHVIESTVRS